MEALIACLWRLLAAIVMSLSMLVVTDYGEHYHGAICGDCRDYWNR